MGDRDIGGEAVGEPEVEVAVVTESIDVVESVLDVLFELVREGDVNKSNGELKRLLERLGFVISSNISSSAASSY